VPFLIAGVAIASAKVKGDTGAENLNSFQQHSDGILLAGLLWSIGVVLFIWFLGSLRSHFAAAEGGVGRLTALAYGGGLAAAVLTILIPAGDQVAALNKDEIDASGASVLHNLSDGFFVAAEYVLPVFFFASAILALRYAALPKWLGWLSVLIGLVLLVGPIGWAAYIFATPVWIIIVSVTLWMRAERTATTTPAVSTS